MSVDDPALPPEYQPALIRDGLADEDRAEFMAAYHDAIQQGHDSLDLGQMFEVLARYGAIRSLGSGEAAVGSVTGAELWGIVARRLAAPIRA